MKKLYLFLFLAAIFHHTTFAAEISSSDALGIAKTYFTQRANAVNTAKQQKAPQLNTLKLAYTAKTKITGKTLAESNLFYVFNKDISGGFVVIAADNRIKPILGYADEGTFETENMPQSLKMWLQNYEEEIASVIANVSDNANSTVPEIQQTAAQTNAVKPLLGSINWDQSAPYNYLCPKDPTNNQLSVTGCVATAIAQIMRYHRWPDIGKGTKTYQTSSNKLTLTANFAEKKYDWDNMLPYYIGTQTAQQDTAVAFLMYHIGVSVSMDYKSAASGGSGALTPSAVSALVDNFKYDNGTQIYFREFFPMSQWVAMLKTEMDAGRPVIYAGNTLQSAGHAFVCDGYDDSGKFHFNWGWGGLSNGYFELTALTPTQQGIGSSNGGYNVKQMIITGVRPPVANSLKKAVIGISGLTATEASIARSATTVINIKDLYNYGAFSYDNGAFGLALYKNSKFYCVVAEGGVGAVASRTGWSSFSWDNVQFNDTISAGNYELKLIYKNEQNKWTPMLVKQAIYAPLNVQITASNINFTSIPVNVSLQMAAPLTTIGKLYRYQTGQYQLQINNNGNTEYYGQIGLRVVSKTDATKYQLVATSLVDIGVNETKTIQLSGIIGLDAGMYQLSVYYDKNNSSTSTYFPTTGLYSVDVELLPTPGEFPDVSLAAAPTFPDVVTIGESFVVSAQIKNSKGVFEGLVAGMMLSEDEKSTLLNFGEQKAVIDAGMQQTYQFNGNITTLPVGKYVVVLANKGLLSTMYNIFGGAENKKTIQLVPPTTGVKTVENSSDIKVKITKTDFYVDVPENTRLIVLSDLQGRTIKNIQPFGQTKDIRVAASDVPKGIYVLRVATREKSYSVKVLK